MRPCNIILISRQSLYPPDTRTAAQEERTLTHTRHPFGCDCRARVLGLWVKRKGRDRRCYACAHFLRLGVAALGSGEVAGLRGVVKGERLLLYGHGAGARSPQSVLLLPVAKPLPLPLLPRGSVLRIMARLARDEWNGKPRHGWGVLRGRLGLDIGE